MKWSAVSLLLGAALAASKQPNILFILTDDQDLHMNSLEYMPSVQKRIADKGTTFNKHFCTVALCCPSRANLWTGKAPHNTNVTDVKPPYGGYPKFVAEGWNDNYLPVWLQEAGYNTYYTGKLWNGHTISNYHSPYAKGFNGSDFLLDPYTYRYYDSVMSRNGAEPVSYAGNYSTDVIAEKALGFLSEAVSSPQPWFVAVAPIAPHSNMVYNKTTNVSALRAPEYAPRHAHLFEEYLIPRDSSFNVEIEGGVSWIKDLPILNDTVIAYNDEYQRSRLRALQAVDEMVEVLFQKLEDAGVLDNTYVFYTTDNGYHISQHRMNPGKECGFDTDIHIPLLVRGSGVPQNGTIEAVTSHTDISPTILSLAGVLKTLDGKVIPLSAQAAQDFSSEHAAIEYWGYAVPEGLYGYHSNSDSETGAIVGEYLNNTYKGLRLVSDEYSIYYSVWCTNEVEFYDLTVDPTQIRNIASNPSDIADYQLFSRPFSEVVTRLDALMMVLKSCDGKQCAQPWNELHPQGDVRNLKDALNSQFDAFYDNQAKVSFSACELGYIKSSEGPQNFAVFPKGSGPQTNTFRVNSGQVYLDDDDWYLYI